MKGICIDVNEVVADNIDISKVLDVVKKVMVEDLVYVVIKCDMVGLVRDLGMKTYTDRMCRIEGKLAGAALMPFENKRVFKNKDCVMICQSSLKYGGKENALAFTDVTYETLWNALRR